MRVVVRVQARHIWLASCVCVTEREGLADLLRVEQAGIEGRQHLRGEIRVGHADEDPPNGHPRPPGSGRLDGP